MAYYDASNGDLRLYRCASAICDSGSSVLIDSLGTRGRNPTMLFSNSAPWIAYDDTLTGELRVARGMAPFAAANFVTFTAAMGSDAAMTVDANGFVDLVFRKLVGDSLERVRCLDASCASLAQSTLDAAGRGFAPSATRLPNGNLLVSHHQPSLGAMLATVCNDADCTAPQRLQLESGPDYGPTSVAESYSSGRPLIHYYDAALTELRSTQCTTTACTSFIRRATNGVPALAPNIALRSTVVRWGYGPSCAVRASASARIRNAHQWCIATRVASTRMLRVPPSAFVRTVVRLPTTRMLAAVLPGTVPMQSAPRVRIGTSVVRATRPVASPSWRFVLTVVR